MNNSGESCCPPAPTIVGHETKNDDRPPAPTIVGNDETKNDDRLDAMGPLKRLRLYGLDPKVHSSSPSTQARHESLRRASILILLSNHDCGEEDHYRILMTQRSHHLRSHPGEVCFPGGKQDLADQGDDWITAYRETKEEVGLELNQMERIARFPTIESINHLCVTPLVGLIDQSSSELDKSIQINPSEVEHSFWVPLRYFCTATPDQEYEIPWQGEIFVFRKYMFPLDGGRLIPITGLTAHVAKQVADIAFPDDAMQSSDTTSVMAAISTAPQVEHRGMLWRQQDDDKYMSNTTRSAVVGTTTWRWVKRYFVLSGGMLHQYDHQHGAERKSHTATKKNRLRLRNDKSVRISSTAPEDDIVATHFEGETERFPFQVTAAEGRIVWTLAASSDQERSLWKGWILTNV
jgi:8-oxo-dGTP pyrophosphatase MutT (NUDIX family)